MAYRNNLQADALKLVAKKLQPSLAVKVEVIHKSGGKWRGRHRPLARGPCRLGLDT